MLVSHDLECENCADVTSQIYHSDEKLKCQRLVGIRGRPVERKSKHTRPCGGQLEIIWAGSSPGFTVS